MMRAALVASLAWHDYRADARLSACAVLALVAVIAPLLVLFGLKFGLVGSLTQRLERDPAVRRFLERKRSNLKPAPADDAWR